LNHYKQAFLSTITEFKLKEAMNFSSSIAFYVIFSLPAVLIITTSIAGVLYEDDIVRRSLIQQFQLLFGEESAKAIDRVLENANESIYSNWARLFGFVMLLISATTVFVSLQDGINKVWGVRAKPDKNVWMFFKNRALSLAMAGSIGFLMLVSLLVEAMINIFDEFILSQLEIQNFSLVTLVNFLASSVLTTFVFTCLFKVIPDVKTKWSNILGGAIFTTLLFVVGKFLIGFYLGNSSLGNVYGAAGSLVILLVWIFFSSMIVLFGAQFTAFYSRVVDGEIIPSENAEIINS
jgi:membrane protein